MWEYVQDVAAMEVAAIRWHRRAAKAQKHAENARSDALVKDSDSAEAIAQVRKENLKDSTPCTQWEHPCYISIIVCWVVLDCSCWKGLAVCAGYGIGYRY